MKFYKFSRASSNLEIPYNIFDNIVKAPNAGNYDYVKNRELYDEPHNVLKDKLGWRFIYSFAKESNRLKKLEIDMKYSEIQKMKVKDAKRAVKNALIDSVIDCGKELIGIRDGDEDEAAKVILQNHPDWKYCNQTLYVHNQNDGMWSSNRCVQDLIISQFSDQLDILTADKKSKTGRNYSKCTKKCQGIYSKLHQYTLDDNWIERTENSSRGFLLYKNGYYDLIKDIFYNSDDNKYDPNIVFMYKIDHDYCKPNESDLLYIDSIKERLFLQSLGEEQGNYLLQLLSRGISGEKMKRMFFGLGPSNSGKSIISRAISLSCGQYVGNFNEENLSTENKSADEAQRLRWAFLLKNKRIILSNEMTTKVKLDGNMIKKISSGGDSLIGRVHGGLKTSYVPQFLTIIFANDIPEIIPYDDAVDKRLIVGSFNKCFVSNPSNNLELQKDDLLENEMTTMKFQQAFLNLLITTYIKHVNNGFIDNIPDKIHEAKLDWIGVNSKQDDQRFSSIIEFQDHFEFTNEITDFTAIYSILAWISCHCKGISSKKFIIEMKKYCSIYNYNNIETKKKSIDGSKIFGCVALYHTSMYILTYC